MNGFFADAFSRFAPLGNDSVRELRWKAESALEHLRENEAFLRQFPTGAVDERLALWKPLTDLLARAAHDPTLADDARLEAQRVWAEEMRHSALVTVTMSVHAQSEAVKARFRNDPEQLEEVIEKLERARPAALRLLSREELDELRRHGFLREGE
jgi:hypothetical protein